MIDIKFHQLVDRLDKNTRIRIETDNFTILKECTVEQLKADVSENRNIYVDHYLDRVISLSVNMTGQLVMTII